MQQGADFALAIGAIPGAPAFGELFDATILNEVTRERPELFSDLAPIPPGLRL